MNWGYKIVFAYIAFVLGITFMVIRSSTQKTDLVTTDYYAKELKYQDKIDEMNRTVALKSPVKCEIKNGQLVIEFPEEFRNKKLEGELVLYCPSDENRDVKKTFLVKDEPLLLPLSSVKTGQYELHLGWKEGGLSYYFEKKIFI
jgi:hypothetical protein